MPKNAKRKKILDIAGKLFAEQGFEKTTIRDIAKAAKVNTAMLYYYFEDKEDLVFQTLYETLSEGLEHVKKIAQNNKNGREKLLDITEAYAQYHLPKIDRLRVALFERKSLKPEHEKKVVKKAREHVNLITDVLDSLKKEGEIADLDSSVCAFAFFGMVHWCSHWYNPKGKIKPKELAKSFNRILSKGIF